MTDHLTNRAELMRELNRIVDEHPRVDYRFAPITSKQIVANLERIDSRITIVRIAMAFYGITTLLLCTTILVMLAYALLE